MMYAFLRFMLCSRVSSAGTTESILRWQSRQGDTFSHGHHVGKQHNLQASAITNYFAGV